MVVWFLFKETAATTSKFFYALEKDSKGESSNRKDLGKRLRHTGRRNISQKNFKILNEGFYFTEENICEKKKHEKQTYQNFF